MAKIQKLSSLHFDGKPQEIGTFYNGEQISFGDAVPGQEISWVRLNSGLLIACCCVCTNISWEQLNKKGLVFGTPNIIDGETYLCRCLKVGTKGNESSEWDAALDETGEDNNLWHWDNMYFWGQETSKHGASHRAVRGWVSARRWDYCIATYRDVYIGFRPVLEHLGSGLCSPDILLGKKTKVYCPDGVTIEGRLIDFSDYDVVLETNSPLAADCLSTIKEGRNLVIDRRNINWMKEM